MQSQVFKITRCLQTYRTRLGGNGGLSHCYLTIWRYCPLELLLLHLHLR